MKIPNCGTLILSVDLLFETLAICTQLQFHMGRSITLSNFNSSPAENMRSRPRVLQCFTDGKRAPLDPRAPTHSIHARADPGGRGPCPPSLAECTKMRHFGIYKNSKKILGGGHNPLPRNPTPCPRSPTLDPPLHTWPVFTSLSISAEMQTSLQRSQYLDIVATWRGSRERYKEKGHLRTDGLRPVLIGRPLTVMSSVYAYLSADTEWTT